MRVEFTRRAERELRRIADHAVRRRILKRVSMLKDEPRPPGARKLSDAKDVWRVRVGDWRVCYQVRDRLLLVLIVAVGHRGDVYERLTRRFG